MDKESCSNKIVISIPTISRSRREIGSALVKKYGTNYLLAGNIFQDLIEKEYCLVQIDNFKEEERQQPIELDLALPKKIFSKQTIQAINNCDLVIYLTSHKLGYNACLRMAKYAQIFLNLGGIAVKVNSTGISHIKNKWLANYNSQDVFELYSLFVTLLKSDREYYSCGMHNFGKADVSLDLTEDIGLANYVMNVFNYYRLTDSVILQDGETFQPDLECPIYRMKWNEDNNNYEKNSLLFNCYGKWHLSRVTENLEITYRVN